MNLLTVLLGVLGGSLVLAALSWKWCLPGRKTSAIILLATVVAFGCGWLALRSGWSWWLVLGVSGAAQLIVYVGTILWIFYLDPERKVLSDPRLVLSPADGTVVYIRQLEAGEPLRSDKNGAAMILDEFNATRLGAYTALADRNFDGLHRRACEPLSHPGQGDSSEAPLRPVP